jgi:hypothetical protein
MIVEVQEVDGDLVLPIPQEILDELGWVVDDLLVWDISESGVVILSKLKD